MSIHNICKNSNTYECNLCTIINNFFTEPNYVRNIVNRSKQIEKPPSISEIPYSEYNKLEESYLAQITELLKLSKNTPNLDPNHKIDRRSVKQHINRLVENSRLLVTNSDSRSPRYKLGDAWGLYANLNQQIYDMSIDLIEHFGTDYSVLSDIRNTVNHNVKKLAPPGTEKAIPDILGAFFKDTGRYLIQDDRCVQCGLKFKDNSKIQLSTRIQFQLITCPFSEAVFENEESRFIQILDSLIFHYGFPTERRQKIFIDLGDTSIKVEEFDTVLNEFKNYMHDYKDLQWYRILEISKLNFGYTHRICPTKDSQPEIKLRRKELPPYSIQKKIIKDYGNIFEKNAPIDISEPTFNIGVLPVPNLTAKRNIQEVMNYFIDILLEYQNKNVSRDSISRLKYLCGSYWKQTVCHHCGNLIDFGFVSWMDPEMIKALKLQFLEKDPRNWKRWYSKITLAKYSTEYPSVHQLIDDMEKIGKDFIRFQESHILHFINLNLQSDAVVKIMRGRIRYFHPWCIDSGEFQ